MIKLASFLTVLTLTLAGDIESGNWGILYLVKRPSKCYGYDFPKNRLYTRDCNKADDLQLWRYDTKTHQLQNKGMTDMSGKPYCAVMVNPGGNGKPIIMGPCLQSGYSAFLLRTQGKAQAFVISRDTKTCIDASWWASANDEEMQTNPCEQLSQDNTDHWTIFSSVGKYKGRVLSKLPKQKNFRNGAWGSLSVSPQHVGCYGIEANSGKLQQQTCDNLNEGQKWRYDVASKTMSNYKYPLGASGSCITLEGSRFYARRCHGGGNQKFLINDGVRYDGTYQRIQLYTDARKCIDIDRFWGHTGNRSISPTNCESIDNAGSDHWLRFNYWKKN